MLDLIFRQQLWHHCANSHAVWNAITMSEQPGPTFPCTGSLRLRMLDTVDEGAKYGTALAVARTVAGPAIGLRL